MSIWHSNMNQRQSPNPNKQWTNWETAKKRRCEPWFMIALKNHQREQNTKFKTHSATDVFTPRSTQISKIATTNKLRIMKRGTIQHTHNVFSSNHMFPSQNLQQSRLPYKITINKVLLTIINSDERTMFTGSVSTDEEASRSRSDVEVEVEEKRRELL